MSTRAAEEHSLTSPQVRTPRPWRDRCRSGRVRKGYAAVRTPSGPQSGGTHPCVPPDDLANPQVKDSSTPPFGGGTHSGPSESRNFLATLKADTFS